MNIVSAVLVMLIALQMKNIPCDISNDRMLAKWSGWSGWSSCNVTCGSGYEYRNRTCNYTSALHVNLSCLTSDNNTRESEIMSKSCNGMQCRDVSCIGIKHNEAGRCVCKNGLLDSNCNRNDSLCANNPCRNNEVCSKFVGSPQRCASKQYQFYLLQQIPFSQYLSSNYTKTLEEYVRAAYMGNIGKSRRKRKIKENIIVEVVSSKEVANYTYVILIAFKGISTYTYLKATEVCAKVSASDVKCLNQTDCNILQNAGVNCPVTFTIVAPTTSLPNKPVPILTGGVIAIIVAVGIVLVILVVGGIILQVRKRYVKKEREDGNQTHMVHLDQEPIPLPSMFEATTDMSVYKQQFSNNANTPGKENSEIISDDVFTDCQTTRVDAGVEVDQTYANTKEESTVNED